MWRYASGARCAAVFLGVLGVGTGGSSLLVGTNAWAAERDVIADVAEQVAPSVVSITTLGTSKASPTNIMPFPFFSPHQGRGGRRMPPARGVASGVIISADGEIITNNHVVEGMDQIRVHLTDGREFEAKVIGTDPPTDLALLRVSAKGLPSLKIGDSGRLRLGETVLAVGNPFGVGQTVTRGIVSAKGRTNIGITDYEDFIQTDAAINPGNSGGALVNTSGELVGINTAILSRSGGTQGIGFAVPTQLMEPIVDQIRKHGKVARGWLGVAIQDVTIELKDALKLPSAKGALVSDVVDKSPASKAGLESGDVIVALNGEEVASASQLRNGVAILGPNVNVKLAILRKGSRKELSLKLGEKKGDILSQSGRDDSLLGGVSLQDLTPDLRRELGLPSRLGAGVLVADVDPTSSAAQSGLAEGDVIVSVNNKKIESVSDFSRLGIDGDKSVLLRVWRRGSFIFIVLRR